MILPYLHQILREASSNFEETLRHQSTHQQVSIAATSNMATTSTVERPHRPFPMSFDERISGQTSADDAVAGARRGVTSQRRLQMNDPWKPMAARSSSNIQTSPTFARSSLQPPDSSTPSRDVTTAAGDDVSSSSCAVDTEDVSNVRFSVTQNDGAPAATNGDDATAQQRENATSQ